MISKDIEKDFNLSEGIDTAVEKILSNRHANLQTISLKNLDFNDQVLDNLVENKAPRHLKQYNPLDLIEMHEYKRIKSNQIALSSQKQYEKQNLPLVSISELKLVTFHTYKIQPTCLAASLHFILICTQTGAIILFNNSGDVVKEIHGKGTKKPISADVCKDETVALIGFDDGSIELWNLKKGKLLKSIRDLHSCEVIAVKFWRKQWNNLISGDIHGKVIISEYKKRTIRSNVKCFVMFDGQIGSILAIEVQNVKKNTENYELIVIAGSKQVAVAVLEPEIKILFILERSEDISEISFPCVKWFENSENFEYFLAISWGNSVSIYKYIEKAEVNFESQGFVLAEIDVKGIFWLDLELILVFGQKSEIFVFKFEKICRERHECDSNKCVIRRSQGNTKVISQEYLKMSTLSVETYHNTVVSCGGAVFILGNPGFYKCFALNWEGCLNELCKNHDWLDGLSLGLDFFKGKYKKTYKTAKNSEKLLETLIEMVKNYIKVTGLHIKHRIYNSISFCLALGQKDLIFVNLYEFFLTENPSEAVPFFIETIENLIFSHQIKSIPTFILSKMCEHYKDPQKLESIILNLDSKSFKPSTALSISEDFNLSTALIYISTNALQDYLFPLKALLKLINSESNPSKKLYITYKGLWYIRMTLQGKVFPNEKIPELNKTSIVVQVLKWVLKWKHISNFLQIDCAGTLRALEFIFSEELPCRLIMDPENGLPDVSSLIQTLLNISQPGEFAYYQVCIFTILTFYYNGVVIEKNLLIPMVLNVIQTHSFKNASVDGCDIFEYIANFLILSPPQVCFSQCSVEEIDLASSTLLSQCRCITAEELETLYKVTRFSAYTEVFLVVLEYSKMYRDCLDLLVQSQNPRTKLRTFVWIQEKFSRLDPVEKNDFSELLKKYLAKLLEIDANKAENIILQFYEDCLFSIIRILDNFPDSQRKLINRFSPDKLPCDLVLKNLKILTEKDPEIVLLFLKALDLEKLIDVLDNCVKICLDYELVYPAAYLLEHQHKVTQCADLIIKKCRKGKLEMISEAKIGKFGLVFNNFCKDIVRLVKLCGDNEEELDLSEIKEILFTVLFTIIESENDLKHLKNEYFEGKIQELMCETLSLMTKYINLSQILTEITQKFKNIPFKFFKSSILHIFSMNTSLKNNLQSAISILESENKKNTQQAYKQILKGVSSEESCSNCGLKIHSILRKSKKLLIFLCGHRFHQECSPSKTCKICFTKENRRKTVALFFINKKSKN